MPRHVLIIGGGIIGCCSAYSLSGRGHRVTVLDRGAPCDECCSFGNAGMIVPSHVVPLAAPGMFATALRMMIRPRSPFYVRPRFSRDLIDWGLKFRAAATADHVARSAPLLRDLHLASRACYEQLAEESGNLFGLVKNGLLVLCRTEHGLEEEAAAAAQATRLGIPAEVVDAKRAAEIEPNVRLSVVGGVYYPKDCHLSPGKLMTYLRTTLASRGVCFRWQTEVTAVPTDGDRITSVRAGGEEVAADDFVLCGGSWSSVLARDAGLKLPMEAGKGYSLTLPAPRKRPRVCAILTEARVAVTPMGDSLRFGGTMEMAGLNQNISPGRVRGIIESVPQYLPDFSTDDFKDVSPWSGLRPCSPDGLPYLGRSKKYENLFIATGHAMMGLSLGPISGSLIAQMVDRQPPEIDITLLAPDRYN